MENEKQYYEFMHKISYEGKKDINGFGFVLLGQLPFKKNETAIQYIMTEHPEYIPSDKPIVQNKETCRELARTIHPELEYLISFVRKKKEKTSAEIEGLVKQRDSKNEKDLLENAERKVLQESILKEIGYYSALCDVFIFLNNRQFELYECSRL